MEKEKKPTAVYVKGINGGNGEARLYKLSEPLHGVEYEGDERVVKEYTFVVVSAIYNMYAHETFIFGANEDGAILNWSELSGSYTGDTDIQRALENAGYEVVE